MSVHPLIVEPAPDSARGRRLSEVARQVFRQEAAAVAALARRVGEEFQRAVDLIGNCSGRVVVSGIGKSGLVARKLAATLNCAGAPSVFMHPAEAAHGDLGMVVRGDVAILVSYSGETPELNALISHLAELDIPMISIVGHLNSTLARRVDIVLDAGVDTEACPHGLLPTNSSAAALAMGDALCVALMTSKRTAVADIARVHPGGAIGLRHLRRVRDVASAENPPIVRTGRPVGEALLAMARARRGLVVVTDSDRRPVGVLSHTELERQPSLDSCWLLSEVSSFMGAPFATILEHAPLTEAQEMLAGGHVTVLVVVDADGRVTGVLEKSDAV